MSEPDRRPIRLLAAAYLILGAAMSSQLAPTADEPETLAAALRNVEIVSAAVRGGPTPDWSFHELTGYYFALDTARGWFVRALPVSSPYHALHLFHLLLSTATLVLLHGLALAVGATPRAALLSAVALATLPPFAAHAQTNPKDLPAAFAFVLSLYAVIATATHRSLRWAALAGAALGLAWTTRIHTVFAPAVAWAWWLLAAKPITRRDVALQSLALAVGAVVALALWPWLWSAPFERLATAFGGVGATVFTIPVLYLGEVVPAHEIPWHYRTVVLLATAPASWLALAAIGAATSRDRSRGGWRPPAALALVWLAILWLADGLVWSRYDGIRHFLMALPALALLAGSGADFTMRWLETRGRQGALVALPLVPFALGILAIATLHPYPNAALGAPARALTHLAGVEEGDEIWELDYWGQSYGEAGAWLAANAEPDAEVIVPLFGDLARLSIEGEVRDGLVHDWLPTDRPRYLVVLARRAYWDPPLHRLAREREPVFEIRRSGGRLLAIYRNDA